MKKYIVILGFLLISGVCYCQEVRKEGVKDSLKSEVSADIPSSATPSIATSSSASNIQPVEGFRTNLPSGSAEQPKINPKAIETKVEYPGLLFWDTGMMYGYNGSVTNTLSYVNVAGVNALQQFGNLSIMGNVNLSKGVYNGFGVVNSAGSNLMLGYRINDNISLSAFGGISNAGFMGPTPNITTGYYGGYITLNTNNQKWGIDMGVRRVYNNMTGRWETIPIAMPYFNLGGAKLGVDVGGLVYGIFHKAAEEKALKSGEVDPRRGPAIIAPPVAPMPHFDTIETPKWAEKQLGNQF